MRATTRLTLTATLSATAVLLTACGGGSGSESSSSSDKSAGAAITAKGCNPQNPLLPANTTESCGGDILDTTVAKLVHYNSDTAKPENDIAESITTSDNQNFTIKLKKGYKFSDGTEVKAKNFVDAWNYAANGKNAQNAGSFLEPVEGYEAASKDTAGTVKLTGLKVVDDYTFTIKTTDKVANLPERLGYSAFAPLPDSFYKDPKAYGDKPVSAGPYMVDSWTQNQSVVLKKNPHYTGKFPGKAEQITFKIYQDPDSAYNDVQAGNLDVTDEVPTSAMVDDRYKQELPNRNAQKEYGGIVTMTFASPKADPTVQNPKLRQAISMAVDRATIVKKIYNNSRKPATGWVSPVVTGYKADQCGEFCSYNPAKAKQLLTEAGGYPGTLTLSYNGDGSHKDWTEATCNSISKTLGIKCVATPVVDFKTMRTQIKKREIKGMFRTGWNMDYPSIENFLTPIFSTGGSSNDGDYSNPAFDAKLKEAAAATDTAKSQALYQEAEKMLTQQMPAVPLWYYVATIGWSDKVADVNITPFGRPDYAAIATK